MYHHSSRLDRSPLTVPSLLSALPFRSPTSIYDSLLSSTHSLKDKWTKLETLGDTDGIDGGHRVVENAYGSTGCVNTMDWEEGNEERLATAGDDTKICIWKPGYTKSNSDTRNFVGYGLCSTISTGHTANIFSIKWAPQSPSRLFSAAGDCTVRVFDISSTSNPNLSTSLMTTQTSTGTTLPWSHHSTSACTRVIRCHTDRVKRISTEPYSPEVFLTCSEDGTVRQHDLRETPHSCRRQSSRRGIYGGGNTFASSSTSSSSCPPPLADYGNMRLYSLSLSRLQPHLFTVAGTSPFAYLHDRRMLKTPMIRDWSIDPSSSNLTECVRRFGVPKKPNSKSFIGESIVAVKMNPFDSKDLIVSFSERGIYRFDIFGQTYQPQRQRRRRSTSTRRGKKRTVGHDDNDTEDDDDREEEEDEDLIGFNNQKRADTERDEKGVEESEGHEKKKKKKKTEETYKVEARSIDERRGGNEEEELTQVSTEEEEVLTLETTIAESERQREQLDGRHTDTEESDSSASSNDSPIDSEKEEDPSSSFSPFNPISRTSDTSVPLIAPIQHYVGHANSQTVKDVNFGFQGQTILTGSDDGNFFIFEKEGQGKCLGIFKGDDSVVNVLQPHPRLPLIAISGIDSTVKIFGPSPLPSNSSPATTPNLVGEYETIKKRNESGISDAGLNSRFSSSGLPDALLRLIAQRMNEIQQQGEGGERNVRVVLGGGGGGGREGEGDGDCRIM